MGKKIIFANLLSNWKKLAEHYNIKWRNSFLQWELPSNVSADFALTLTLPISHKTKRNPLEIAQEIVKTTACPGLEWKITEKGYINFSFPTGYYQQFFTETLEKEGQNLRSSKKNIRLNLEYVSANPTGYLHLAHFRHAFIGNMFANVYQFCGYEVTREYYINDRGVQITSLVHSVHHLYQLYITKNTSDYSDEKKHEYILSRASREIAQKLVERWGNKYIKEELNDNDVILWKKEVLDLILTKIRQDLEKCGVKFDIWSSETSLYKKNKHQGLLTELKKKNLIYSQDGAVFFRSTLKGDDKDRVIIKNDGDYTYFFSDILYHLDKIRRADKLINIWGADHHGTIARLKSACQLLGYNPENIQIVLVQIVSLLTKDKRTERFSKRAGNSIELAEILQYMDIDQLKFLLLEKDSNQPISINAELLKENREKTRLYYIQYAHSRCHQIFQKARERDIVKISSSIDLLRKKNERGIFRLLVQFPFVLETIIEENKPHYLIHYLYALSQTWQTYYQNSTILEQENRELTSQKLLLVKNIQIILKLGLELMGINAPERM